MSAVSAVGAERDCHLFLIKYLVALQIFIVSLNAPKQIWKRIEVNEDFTVSRMIISNLFCVVLVNMIPFPRTATLKHLSHNGTTVYV